MPYLLIAAITAFLVTGTHVLGGEYPNRKLTEAEAKVRREIIQELKEKAKDCHIEELKRDLNEAWGKALEVKEEDDLLIQKFIVIYNGLEDIKTKLKEKGLSLEFGISKEFSDRCSLSQEALQFNFGSIEALMGIKRMIDFQSKDTAYKMDRIRIEIVAQSGVDLYKKNRSPQIVDGVAYVKQDDAEVRIDYKVATIYVNGGDYQTGIILFPFMEALTKR